ncbi:MAG TPA: hypothetical protein VK886_20120 [Vicinamibacterales bacterium]|nr:hypothetical protein [Vicinamibacterales bacterium]
MRTLAAFLLLWPAVAAAQTPPGPDLPRGDVAGAVGWLHAPVDDLTTGFFRAGDWTRHATIAGTAGAYWTEHWKIEIAAEHSSTADVWDSEVVQVGRDSTQRSVYHQVTFSRFSLAQFYQFGRNQWVHPSLGAGVVLLRREIVTEYSPATLYRSDRGTAETIAPGERLPPRATTVAAPMIAAAVKAYLTPRAFFRGDGQVALRGGPDSVVFHAGFGFDF